MICQKLAKNESKIEQKLIKNWPKIEQKWIKNWPKIDKKLTKNESKIEQKLSKNWPNSWLNRVLVGRKLGPVMIRIHARLPPRWLDGAGEREAGE